MGEAGNVALAYEMNLASRGVDLTIVNVIDRDAAV
jgi:hypothetical protein